MQIIMTRLPEDLEIPAEISSEIARALELMGRLYEAEDSEVSLTLTTDAEIRKLNRDYREIDRATDVLSFALSESDAPEVTGGPETEVLGDIIISMERARAQAETYGHSLLREAVFLAVHGMLHLLGYDHIAEDDRREMEAEQRFVMERLGIGREAASLSEHGGSEDGTQKAQGKASKKAQNAGAEKHKSGFIAVIGRPNVGKSTLINSLIGQKIAIMSDKPQTTRNRILCILTQSDAQVVFLDTPGIHKPKHKLGEYMLRAAEGTLKEVDAIFFVVDATEKMGPGERYILERLEATKRPVILVINKLDLIAKEDVLPIIVRYTEAYAFAGVVPISAKEETNLAALLSEAKKYLPAGPKYYPDDMVTDQPERLIVAELVREKVLHRTRDEVPHAIAVDVDEMTTRPKGDVYIRATIYIERESQKGIIIGAKGALLKEIGQEARKDIEMLLGAKVFLDLWVKVKKDWRNRENVLKGLGFDG